MSADLIAFSVIIFLLLASNIYWGMVCNRLVNKLMSRSYFEFEQARALQSPKAQPLQAVDEIDHEAERQARELNSIMGVV